jgi:hypothetical protein
VAFCDGRDDDDVPILTAANLGLKFALELAAIAAFAYWGAGVDGGVVSVLLAIVAPAVAVVLWGVFAAPKSERRLPRDARVAFELSVFGFAVVALFAAGSPVSAVVFAAIVVVNVVLMTAFRQWEQ